MTFYLVYVTATGKAESYGTILADPMPAEYTVRPMTEDETSGVLDGRLMWDAETLAFVQNPYWTSFEPDVV